jgi:surfeit locus 1 family protein
MSRRFPWGATVLVLAAVAVMIGLGVWQLHRKAWKEGLITRYEAAQGLSAEVPFPRHDSEVEAVLYRRSRIDCLAVGNPRGIAGNDAAGASGIARTVDCKVAGGGVIPVILGWSRAPMSPDWRGGTVAGTIGSGPKLVADPPLAGLAANARPDPRDLPNNHLSYAVQWFLFAATALVIYAIALWKRLRVPPS